MRRGMFFCIMACFAGIAFGGALEAKLGLFGHFGRVFSPDFKLAVYRGQQISNEVNGRVDRILLPVELRRQLKDLQAEEVALRDRALSLKTIEEVEAARNESFVLWEKRQLFQNFILRHGRDIDQRKVLADFIAGKFNSDFPVILEAEVYDQVLSNFTAVLGSGVQVIDLTDQIIELLQQEIDGIAAQESR